MVDINAEKVTINPVRWSEAVNAHLDLIHGSVTTEWYEAECLSGRLTVYGFFYNGEHLGSAATRIEDKEFVLVAVGGSAAFDLTKETLPYFEMIATAHGCTTIRFHTMRKGLIKKTVGQGWNVRETIMQKELI